MSTRPTNSPAPIGQPPVAPPGPWQFPTPERADLDNGIEVITYQLPGQHVISGHLVLDVPLSAEDRALEGIATMTTRTLDEGSKTHSGEEFAELLETEGAAFGIDMSLSGLQAILDVPASRLEPALALFAEAMIEPALEDADVDRHVQLRLAEIEQSQANSAQAASIAFRKVIFDESFRGSRMNGGEPETVAALDGAAVRQFHQDHFGPAGAKLILAGDFTTGSGRDPFELAEKYFGGWRNDAQIRTQQPKPTGADRSALIIDRPGSVQADLRLGGFGIDRRDPRWADITVASYAMGGGFLSRLNSVLREDKGYTYGVRMTFGPMRQHGSFAIQGSFRTEVMADALSEAQALLDIGNRPFTESEVTDAVNFFTGVSPLRYATADGVGDQAASHALNELPDNYVDLNLAALRAVTPDSATRAYTELVDPQALSLVIVGDATALADPIRAAGFEHLNVTEA